MRIHLVIDESGFFLPSFVDHLLDHLPEGVEAVGVTVLQNPPNIPTVYSHLRKHLLDIGMASCLRLGRLAALQAIRSAASRIGFRTAPGSVTGAVRRHDLPCRLVVDVNASETIDWIRGQSPDLLVSSCSQIFRSELLELPAIGAINRHSSLLPAYGGLLPIFQALLHEDSTVGSSVHVMTPEIDGGTVITQSSFKVDAEMTVYDCYERSYADCGPLTVEAITRVREKGNQSIDEMDFGVEARLTASYFGPPSDEDWRRFRASGRRFC